MVLGSCGFQSRSGAGAPDDGAIDAPPDDGPGSGSDDGSGAASTCLQHWLDATVTIAGSSVEELTALKSNGDDRDPWISKDGKRLYFARSPGMKGGSDIYRTTRVSPDDAFDDGSNLVNLNTADQEDRAALTPDETMLVLSTNHNVAGGKAHIAIAIRTDTGVEFGTPDERTLSNVNGDSSNHYDPFPSQDGLRLYLAPTSGPSNRQEIRVAVRATLTGEFITPVDVGGINSSNTNNADPALSLDERILLFTSDRGGGGARHDLYYATRPNLVSGFGTPRPIPTVNSTEEEGDPMLSADGCELYFASTRDGGRFHLFHAQITK
jgi:Tol biopolymer transport system component